MKNIFKIFALILCAFVFLTSCSGQSVSSVNVSSSHNGEYTDLNSLMYSMMGEDRYKEIEAFIDSVQPEFDEWLSLVGYLLYVDEMDTLTEVGIEGIPVLIIKYNGEEDYLKYNQFLSEAIFALLRIDMVDLEQDIENANPFKFAKSFNQVYKLAQETLPKIDMSFKSDEEKINEYRKFGLLAWPYVVDELKSGKEIYQKYCILIGLHLSTADYLKCMHVEDPMVEPKITDEQQIAELKRTANELSEPFDWRVWYEENEEDLNNLFIFLDAYCAEYEANTATE